MACVRIVRVPRRREAWARRQRGVPVIPAIIEIALELIRDAMNAIGSENVAEAERLALLHAQRRISDEIAKREFGVPDTEPPR